MALNSLFDINKKVLVPLQFYIMYTNSIFKNEKRIVNSATSTGTASQESFDKSLENAIVEFLQIDSFNLWWYGGLRGKNLNIDTEGLLKELFPNNNRLWMFLKKFTVNFIDISFDKAINVVVCEITSNSDSKLPKYVRL
nr:YcaO-like family protein [Lactobacillus crispatus]